MGDELKEISNNITCIRILIARDKYEEADQLAEQLQMNILGYIAND